VRRSSCVLLSCSRMRSPDGLQAAPHAHLVRGSGKARAVIPARSLVSALDCRHGHDYGAVIDDATTHK
jgi:hypothetical protein